jgi:hypothetical protein
MKTIMLSSFLLEKSVEELTSLYNIKLQYYLWRQYFFHTLESTVTYILI